MENKEEMLSEIYEKIADKGFCNGLKVIHYRYEQDYDDFTETEAKIITEEYGCNRDIFIISDGDYDRITFDYITVDDVLQAEKDVDTYSLKIIGHPVMYGDVLDYIEKNNNWWIKGNNPAITQYNGDMEEMFENCFSLYEEKRKPIEEQSDDCIKYVYNLIS